MDYFTLGYTVSQIFVFFLVLGILWKIKGWRTHTNTAASIFNCFWGSWGHLSVSILDCKDLKQRICKIALESC